MDYAEATCVLKINIHCQACKIKMLGVFNSICGLYNVDIDSEQGIVRVSGLVDPEMLMRALARTGYHAELKWVNLHHPKIRRYNSPSYDEDYNPYNYGYGHGYGGYRYGAIEEPYHHRRQPWNNYATMPGYGIGYPYYHNGLTRTYNPNRMYQEMDSFI